MHWRGLLCAAWLLGGWLAVAGQTPPEAVSHLQRAFPGLQFYSEAGQTARIYAVPFGFGATPEDSAAGFVVAHSGVFGLAPAELVPGNRRTGQFAQQVMYDPDSGTYRFTLLYYSQFRAGLPVYRAELRLLVLNQPGYPLVWAASSLRDLGEFTVPAVVSAGVAEEQARVAAARLVPGLVNFTPADLVIWAGIYGMENVAPAVAVRFVGDNGLEGSADYQRWEFVADAVSGDILYRENLILYTDVIGSVQGKATDTIPPKADVCNPENPLPFPYAKVSIESTVAYTDAEGNFTIPWDGTTQVTVTSTIAGKYFFVQNQAGANEVLTVNVVPPGPADFMHNLFNGGADEYIRAQVNGYVQANIVRDFVLAYNPQYPVIWDQLNFPVKVNISQTCNAFYDGSAINFFRAGGGCSNTAFSGVVHHEYGHHLVAVGGSGQGQYGEGMSDCVGILIADDPILAYGFYSANCVGGIRNADNNYQYPCSGEIHDCGQLLSGCVWSTRNALKANYPTTYREILCTLTINSILLHPGDLITPAITIDFLTLDDTDGNIYNGTPHYNEICAGFGAHNMACPALQSGLKVSPAGGFESGGNPGGPFAPQFVDYTVKNIGLTSVEYAVTSTQAWTSLSNAAGTLAPGQETVVTVSINSAANSLAMGTYYAGIKFTNLTDHVGDTTRAVTLLVGGPRPVYTWDMDTDPGWVVSGGQWSGGTPTGGGGEYGCKDPTGGYTGTKVYGYNLDGDYADNLPEYHLTTTPLDCTDKVQVKLRFRRWLGVERSTFDHAYVRVSNDGQVWTTVWENPDVDTADGGWTLCQYDISAVADQATVYVRWTMGTTDSAWRFCGWNIDDVEIWAADACVSATILGQPQGQKRLVGQPVTFTTSATGTAPLEYQWRKDGQDIGGANSDTLAIPAVTLDDAGDYDCVVTNDCGSATSAAAHLGVYILGDLDCNGLVDFDDINPFVMALGDPGGYEAAYPNCYIMSADCNGDGVVSFDDINDFVGLLTGL